MHKIGQAFSLRHPKNMYINDSLFDEQQFLIVGENIWGFNI